MSDNLNETLTLQMPRRVALSYGLLTCACGHPTNNHFTFDHKTERPCAHCDCKTFREQGRAGIRVVEKKHGGGR